MRFLSHRSHWISALGVFLLFMIAFGRACTAQQPSVAAGPVVNIRQLHDVEQGGSGWFEIEVDPQFSQTPVTLRLRRLAGMGAASFSDGTDEYQLEENGNVEVRGLMASDLAGGMALTAWLNGAKNPATTLFFDVMAATPQPRIFWDGRDITGTTQTVVAGQQIRLNVTLHPGLQIRDQRWTIEPLGEYVGGFVHRPEHGGPQPVSLSGPTVTIYWVRLGAERRVTYRVTMSNGETSTAAARFDVEGPSVRDIQVPLVELKVGRGTEPNSSYMSFAGSGISFRAHYNLPEGLMRNYTWVQLVTRDVIAVSVGKGVMSCTPKSLPEPEVGAGLDTEYPYDWRNPTHDSPPLQLIPAAGEISRRFHARMYLMWGSGMSNSIVVPLGYVAWHFEGHAIRKDLLTNTWTLTNGSGGADDTEHPYQPSKSYPAWGALVPYSGVMNCK